MSLKVFSVLGYEESEDNSGIEWEEKEEHKHEKGYNQSLRRHENTRRKRDKGPAGGASAPETGASGDEGPRQGPENGRPRRRSRPGTIAIPAPLRSEGVNERSRRPRGGALLVSGMMGEVIPEVSSP